MTAAFPGKVARFLRAALSASFAVTRGQPVGLTDASLPVRAQPPSSPPGGAEGGGAERGGAEGGGAERGGAEGGGAELGGAEGGGAERGGAEGGGAELGGDVQMVSIKDTMVVEFWSSNRMIT
ncbi:hypothetical protein NHX12_006081 [Muraenolepis orangiensis]|uniref:Uncharacterized protein n=1 Tax=Muraenolepis orangiensis TaxID=630683 RepID=A0A9Q0DWA0_9TELE|nr:hypothetical protein NHX12_006081 [Muraenolepis orangiensis]